MNWAQRAIVIDGTRERTGDRTTSWLNTGLGNDHVTVNLTADEDGFFVLNTQGQYDNVLGLVADLDDGDEPLAADRVVSITVGGQLVDPSRYSASTRLDLVGLFDSFAPGASVVVALELRTT